MIIRFFFCCFVFLVSNVAFSCNNDRIMKDAKEWAKSYHRLSEKDAESIKVDFPTRLINSSQLITFYSYFEDDSQYRSAVLFDLDCKISDYANEIDTSI